MTAGSAMIMSNWLASLPEIVCLAGGLILLMGGVFAPERGVLLLKGIDLGAIGVLLLAGVLLLGLDGGLAYGGQFIADPMAAYAKLFVIVSAILALTLAMDYETDVEKKRFEYPIVVIFSVIGMMVMVSAANLLMLYLGLELQSLALYVLTAFRRDDRRASEAAVKFFVLGSLASGLFLYGASLIYGFTGTITFTDLVRFLAASRALDLGLVVGLVFVIAGLGFKVAAVPFHMWTPDVYEGAPSPTTAFVGTAPKVATMFLLVRLLGGTFGGLLGHWQIIVEVISIASMIWGALAAIAQNNLKRMMAYSSIGHMGYALIGLACGNQAGLEAVLIYLAIYVFSFAGTLGVIIAARRGGIDCERIADFAGLGREHPGLALAMAVFMFSLAGIPPLSGFFAKLYVFKAAMQTGLVTLAVIGVLTSVIGAFYYLRVIKVMYFDAAPQGVAPRDALPGSLGFAISLSALVTALLFLFPAPLFDLAHEAARHLLG